MTTYPIRGFKRPSIRGHDLDRLRQEWHRSSHELAEMFGVCHRTILNTGLKHGFPERPGRGNPMWVEGHKEKPMPVIKREPLPAGLIFRCAWCCAQFQGEVCPQGHQRERTA